MSNEQIYRELVESFEDKEYANAYVADFLNAAIATQIKVLREDRNLSQKQLAELTEMKQSRISLMENVNYSSWSLATLRRLAAAFDVSLNVSFEAFSKTISEISSFSRESLQRKSRDEDLASISPKTVSIAFSPNAFAPMKQRGQTALEVFLPAIQASAPQISAAEQMIPSSGGSIRSGSDWKYDQKAKEVSIRGYL
jgi:transcriptional regulator with XRE-family HTH domain